MKTRIMPSKIFIIFCTLVALLGSSSLAKALIPSGNSKSPNLLVNGSFERPHVETQAEKTTDGWITYGPSYAVNGPRNGLQGWRVLSGEIDIFSASRTSTTAADGGQYLDLDGRLRGSLAQDVIVASAGRYRLSFQFGRSSNASMRIAVSFLPPGGGSIIQLANRQISATESGSSPGSWATETMEFSTPGDGTVTISLESLQPSSSVNGMKLDNMRLTAVSEPTVIGTDSDGDGVIDTREESDGTDPQDPLSFEVLSRGLAAHYPLDRDLNDASGYQRHASLESDRSTIGFQVGQKQQALQMNANARFSAPVAYELPSGLSFALWARRSGEVFTQITLADGPFQGASFGWGWNEKGQGPGFFFNVDGTWQGPLALGTLDPKRNSWTHVAGTIAKSGLMTVYVDGRKVTSFQIPLEIPWAIAVPDKIVLDFVSRGGGQTLGRIDEVRLYARVLGAAEVSLLHGGGNSDRDGDGLLDRYETNTGKYVSPTNTGTNPDKADTNGDKIPDGWAVRFGLNPLDDFSGIVRYVKQNPGLFDIIAQGDHRRAIREARETGRQDVIKSPRKYGLMKLDDLPLTAGLRLELPEGTSFAMSMPGNWTRLKINKHPSWKESPEGRVSGSTFGKAERQLKFIAYKNSKRTFPLTVTIAPLGASLAGVIELCFEPVFRGKQPDKSETSALGIKNVGGEPITLDKTDIKLPEGFTTSWTRGIIPANGECIDIPITRTPGGSGGTISIGSGGPGVAIKPVIQLPGSVDFGNVPVGRSAKRSLRISNTGNAPLNVKSVQCPVGFSGSWSGTIPPTGFKNIDITFSPTEAKLYRGDIAVLSDADAGQSSIKVQGAGTPPQASELPAIELSSLEFGEVEVVATTSLPLFIRNTGTAALRVEGITYPDGFTAPNWSGSIEPGDSWRIEVTFSPARAGAYHGLIVVASNVVPGRETTTVSGIGRAKQPPPTDNARITISPNPISLIGTAAGGFAAATGSFNIKNHGSSNLVVDSIDANGNNIEFSFEPSNIVVPPGGQQTVLVTAFVFSNSFGWYGPYTHLYEATLTVNSNASAGEGQAVIAIEVNDPGYPTPGPDPSQPDDNYLW